MALRLYRAVHSNKPRFEASLIYSSVCDAIWTLESVR